MTFKKILINAGRTLTEFCSQQGYWQYSFPKSVMPKGRKYIHVQLN